jgi:hypothetical protein
MSRLSRLDLPKILSNFFPTPNGRNGSDYEFGLIAQGEFQRNFCIIEIFFAGELRIKMQEENDEVF